MFRPHVESLGGARLPGWISSAPTASGPIGDTVGVEEHEWASFGPYSEIGSPTISIVHPEGIHVGTFVKIGSYAVIEALVPDRGVTVRIEDGAYIGHFTRITAVGEVVIGEEAMVADRVYISDTNHIYDDVTQPIKRQGLRDGRRVEIGPGAWIGIGAVVVGNLRIGENAIVGANAVVREDVPDRTVVAGNPARIVRHHDGERWQWSQQRGPA